MSSIIKSGKIEVYLQGRDVIFDSKSEICSSRNVYDLFGMIDYLNIATTRLILFGVISQKILSMFKLVWEISIDEYKKIRCFM